MKPVQPLAVSVALVLGFAAGAAGQARVEYGHAAGTSGVAGAAGGKNIGKSLGAVFDKTGRTLQTAGQPSAATAAKPAAAGHSSEPAAETAAKPVAAELPAVDPAAITPGLDRKDLLAKFGGPSMQLTSTDGSDQVEKLYYRRAGHETVVVTLRNGKVASVSPPAETAQAAKP
jgi:Flp pilus assembly pilin Flp